METKTRPKEEVIRDIEASRHDTRKSWRETKGAFGERNAVRTFWKKTKAKVSQAGDATREAASKTKKAAIQAKEKVVGAAAATDKTIRSNIYSSIGIAACVGTAVGYSVTRKLRARRRSRIE